MNKKGFISTFLILIVLFISLNSQISSVKAQGHDYILNRNNQFNMIQYSTLQGFNSSVSNIDINLPTTNWNITNIELGFTNLTFERETITVEDTPTAFDRVYYQNVNQNNYGSATQIRLDHPETIYGVLIYGNKTLTTVQDIQVQIRGYNETNNTPNSTIFLTQTLNMSTTLSWYMQNFSTPLNLPSGNYFLVLNGTSLNIANQGYRWYYNSNPIDSSLYSANTTIKTNNWNDGVDNKTFLYKVIRKSKAPLFPESINMSVNINNQDYQVLNGGAEGNGTLSQAFENFHPASTALSFTVQNNASRTLEFNISYSLYFEEFLPILGTVSIQESHSNQWTLSRTFTRYTDNYSVKFDIPSTWENVSVLRDAVDMTPNITINLSEGYIFLPNNTLIDSADWEIQAESPNFSFGLNAPKTEYYLGQELGFSLVNPRPGNYTFILFDASELEDYRTTQTIPPLENNVFTHEIPSNAPDGTYIGYIFWNNGTDGGVQVLEFLVKLPTPPEFDPTLLIMILVIVGIVAAGAIGSYIGIKKLLDKRKYDIGRVLQKCNDILNINYLIVTDNRSGIDIYSQSFGESKLDSSLISGFLQAIREFGSEASIEKGSRTIKIDYKNTVILMTEFVNVRLILNMKATPSENFHYDIESLAYDIYKNYGNKIDDFRGNIKQFQGIKELVEKNLNTSFIYPLKVVTSENIKLTQSEREMVNKALRFMKEHHFDFIYSLYLLPENECSPKDAQTILNLISKGVFKPEKPEL